MISRSDKAETLCAAIVILFNGRSAWKGLLLLLCKWAMNAAVAAGYLSTAPGSLNYRENKTKRRRKTTKWCIYKSLNFLVDQLVRPAIVAIDAAHVNLSSFSRKNNITTSEMFYFSEWGLNFELTTTVTDSVDCRKRYGTSWSSRNQSLIEGGE